MNNGTDTIKISDNPVMSYSVNGATPVTQSLGIVSNLLPGDSVTFTFTQKQDMHLPSTYNIQVKATVANDVRRNNDSVLNVVKVYPNPVISLGAVSQSYNNKLEHVLSAGSGYVSYLWQDGSSNQDYTITQTHYNKDNLYSVIVTDQFGCIGGDTVAVSLTIKDIRIDSVYLPDETCASSLPLKVKVTNSGNVPINEDIPYTYYVNTFEHSSIFHFSGDTASSQKITLDLPLDFSTTGLKKVLVQLLMQGEIRKANDTLTHFINVKKGVNIDFGAVNDSLTVDLPYTLDPGSGTNYSYVWSTSATTQTISVATKGLYTVTVTNGICTDSKSVTIIGNVYDLRPVSFKVSGDINANNICISTKKQTSTIGIENNGTVVLSNVPITIKYQLNGGPEISKDFTFSGGRKVVNVYSLGDSIDLSQLQTNTFTYSVITVKDDSASNNSGTYSLFTIDKPTITFAGDVNDTIKTTTMPVVIDPGSGTNYSYKWSNDIGSTSRTITTSIERWYAVTVSNDYCTATDSVYLKLLLPTIGIQSVNGVALQIYPNPVRDILSIKLSVKTNENVVLELISQVGAVVKTDKLSGNTQYTHAMDVSDLPRGLYYLKIFRKDWVIIEKIVIR
jgi:hypothetical protein